MVARGLTTPSRQLWLVPLVASLTAGTALVPVAAAAEQVDPRPNVILISADDMRADDILVMDNLRSLLTEQGTTFTNSFASFPVCGPSRLAGHRAVRTQFRGTGQHSTAGWLPGTGLQQHLGYLAGRRRIPDHVPG